MSREGHLRLKDRNPTLYARKKQTEEQSPKTYVKTCTGHAALCLYIIIVYYKKSEDATTNQTNLTPTSKILEKTSIIRHKGDKDKT